jgi:YgiT-type zinc finger domain-containing protein
VNMPRKKALVCDVCGETGAKLRRVARSYGSGADLFVIENVPVISCPHCGESYLTADTLHELERLKAGRRRLAEKRSVPVLAFAS